jgi:hypothetical protein
LLIALWKNENPFIYRHLEEPDAAVERDALAARLLWSPGAPSSMAEGFATERVSLSL